MTAKEAREKADNAQISEQYISIIVAILQASENGHYETWYYEKIENAVRKKLVSEGYGVGETIFDRNETMTKITW